jgi:hypothetical protein
LARNQSGYTEPVKTTGVPFLQGAASMADKPDTKTTTATSTAVGKKDLTPAAEASDPVAQSLLAELQTARLNKNDEGAKKVLDRLAELGYSAE